MLHTVREENKDQGMMWGDKLNFCCDCVSDKMFLFHYVVQDRNTSHEQPEEPAQSNIKYDIQFSISKVYEKHIHAQRTKMSFVLLQHFSWIHENNRSQREMLFAIYLTSVMCNFEAIFDAKLQNSNFLKLHSLIVHNNKKCCLQKTVLYC